MLVKILKSFADGTGFTGIPGQIVDLDGDSAARYFGCGFAEAYQPKRTMVRATKTFFDPRHSYGVCIDEFMDVSAAEADELVQSGFVERVESGPEFATTIERETASKKHHKEKR